jgi:ABC-type transport system involved in multi-copper enzyme maturation permease subunit
VSRRRVAAIVRKELREVRRNRSLLGAMAVLPTVFLIQPLVAVLRLSADVSGSLGNEHVLVYLLGIPILVPTVIAATAVAGERQQGTLEPVLTTPIRRDELLLAKALAALVPSVVIAYAVFGVFLVLVWILAQPSVASALIQPSDLLAQVVFTPLLAAWSIWVGLAISSRSSDARVAQQLALLASLPAVILTLLIAIDVIHPTLRLAAICAALLVVLDALGWRVASRLFDRERLITGPS